MVDLESAEALRAMGLNVSFGFGECGGSEATCARSRGASSAAGPATLGLGRSVDSLVAFLIASMRAVGVMVEAASATGGAGRRNATGRSIAA